MSYGNAWCEQFLYRTEDKIPIEYLNLINLLLPQSSQAQPILIQPQEPLTTPCSAPTTALYIFLLLISQQLILIRIDHRVVAPTSREALPRRISSSSSKHTTHTPPHRSHKQGNSGHNRHSGRDSQYRVSEPWFVGVKSATTVPKTDLSEIAIPIPPDPVADPTCEREGQEND